MTLRAAPPAQDYTAPSFPSRAPACGADGGVQGFLDPLRTAAGLRFLQPVMEQLLSGCGGKKRRCLSLRAASVPSGVFGVVSERKEFQWHSAVGGYAVA